MSGLSARQINRYGANAMGGSVTWSFGHFVVSEGLRRALARAEPPLHHRSFYAHFSRPVWLLLHSSIHICSLHSSFLRFFLMSHLERKTLAEVMQSSQTIADTSAVANCGAFTDLSIPTLLFTCRSGIPVDTLLLAMHLITAQQ
jgi:hypothetical protein